MPVGANRQPHVATDSLTWGGSHRRHQAFGMPFGSPLGHCIGDFCASKATLGEGTPMPCRGAILKLILTDSDRTRIGMDLIGIRLKDRFVGFQRLVASEVAFVVDWKIIGQPRLRLVSTTR
jgi:hypothetical protein